MRDDAKLLPATNLKSDARVFNLAITNGDDRNFVANTFAGAARRMNVRMDTVVLDERSTDQDVEAAIRRASEASLVVASLYGRVRTGQARSVGLPDAGARALNALVERKSPVVAISFGNPYLLGSFPNLRTYLVAYGDMPSLQRAAARAIFGGAGVGGKLPISLPGLYARGTGLTLAPKQNAAGSAQGSDAMNTTAAPRTQRDGVGEGRPR